MKKYLIKLGVLALVFLSAFTLSSCEPPVEDKECDPGYVENQAGDCVLEEQPVVDETAPVISGAVNINYVMEDPAPVYTDDSPVPAPAR